MVNIVIILALLIALAVTIGCVAVAIMLLVESIRSISRWRHGYDD